MQLAPTSQPIRAQLAALIGRPAPASTPAPVAARGSEIAAARGSEIAAASAASAATPVTPVATEAAAAPSAGAALLGRIGDTQRQALANQQLVGLISATLGARLATIGYNVWATLRGTDRAAEPTAEPAVEPSAAVSALTAPSELR